MKKIVLTSLIMLSVSFGTKAESLPETKSFQSIFSEVYSFNLNEATSGTIYFPEISAERGVTLSADDLSSLLDMYKDSVGKRLTAPYNEISYTGGLDNDDTYFFVTINKDVSEKANKKPCVATLYWGGGQNGDIVYGRFGGRKSVYGEEPPMSPLSHNYIWYSPVEKKYFEELGKTLYEKYKIIAEQKTNGISQDDATVVISNEAWLSRFYLPQCLNVEGASEWSVNEIMLAGDRCLLKYNQAAGYSDNITRKDFAVLLAQAINIIPARPVEDYYKSPNGYTQIEKKLQDMNIMQNMDTNNYIDVDIQSNEIKYLSTMGIMQGMGEGIFAPDEFITREQICTVLDRVYSLYEIYPENKANEDVNLFSDDEDISEWAYPSVYRLRNVGIINGNENNCFLPKIYCTTEQAISIINRQFGMYGYLH